MKKIAIGVDVGGSHVSSAAFDIAAKKYLENTFAESDLNNQAKAEIIIQAWGNTIKQSINKVGSENIAGIGIAIPGPFDYEKGIPLFTGENIKYEKIYGLNVPETLRLYLDLPPDFPIRFINDAAAFAIGEAWIGKAKTVTRSLSITLGTGFGSTFLNESLPVSSGRKVPKQGYLWHVDFEDGIADDYFSTRGLLKRYKQLSGKSATNAKEIAEAAESDEKARIVFSDFGTKLIKLLKPWFLKFDVEVLVIGGNISKAFDLFWPAMHNELQKEELNVKIELSKLKETASIVGSARLIEPDFWTQVSPLLKNM